MTIALMPQRPPFVRFEQRAIEDRNASIEAGGIIMRDVDYVIVMQVGGKDTVEKEAIDWLTDIDRMVQNGQCPAEWAAHFRRMYDAFKAGQTAPELGLSVRQWPALSKAQAENLIAAGIRTVEDAAAMNEQSMHRVGLGARELKRKAETYLASRDANKAAEQITSLQAGIENRDVRIASLEERLAALEAAQSKKRA